jgi:hypothetical protein
MRLSWEKSIVGFRKSAILDYIAILEDSFIDKKLELAAAKEDMESSIAEQRERILGRTYNFSNIIDGSVDESLESISFQTVLFGLNKQNVRRNLVKIKQKQNEELTPLYEQVKAVFMEYEKLTENNTVLEDKLEIEVEIELEIEVEIDSFIVDEVVSIEEITMFEEPAFEESATSTAEEVIDDETIPIEAEEEEATVTDNSFIESQGVSITGKLLNFPKRGSDLLIISDDNVDISKIEVSQKVYLKKPKLVGMGFWGNADHYLEQPQENFQLNQHSFSELATSNGIVGAEDRRSNPVSDYFTTNETKERKNSNPISFTNRSGFDRRMANNSSPATNSDVFTNSEEINDHSEIVSNEEGSSTITDEIRQMRIKYIVGKISGSVLMDVNGNVIVGKNQRITEAILAKADQNGKLAELVVSMIIPGLEDS